VGSFCGAFFAFLFVRVGEGLKRHYERQEENQKRLTQLQHYLNRTLGLIGRNVFVVDDLLELVTDEKLASGNVPVYMNRFERFEIDAELPIGLTNIDFVNEVYSLNQTLRKVDGSAETTDRALDQVTEAMISGHIEPSAFVENMRRHRDRCIELREFLYAAKDETVKVFAAARVLSKDPPFFIWLLRLLTRRTYRPSFAAARDAEVKLLNKEIDEIAAADKKRIEEVKAKLAAKQEGGSGK
jgi:hypothetical protein